jgi:hypothetical protein
MPRFARMLEQAYLARGHQVQIWSPQPKVYKWVKSGRLSKWAGYIDQYILFPMWVNKQLSQQSVETLLCSATKPLVLGSLWLKAGHMSSMCMTSLPCDQRWVMCRKTPLHGQVDYISVSFAVASVKRGTSFRFPTNRVMIYVILGKYRQSLLKWFITG